VIEAVGEFHVATDSGELGVAFVAGHATVEDIAEDAGDGDHVAILGPQTVGGNAHVLHFGEIAEQVDLGRRQGLRAVDREHGFVIEAVDHHAVRVLAADEAAAVAAHVAPASAR
jgi:hypothetical protein